MLHILQPHQLFIQRKVNQGNVKQQQIVRELITKVQADGDQALFQMTEKFDGAKLSELQVSQEEIQAAYKEVDDSFTTALQEAVKRITHYHEKQKQNSWFASESDGTILGQVTRPLHSVGIYVPGGKAAYPSTVLMNTIPAKVAGVEEIVMVTPPQENGQIFAPTLIAADLLGISKIFKVGGAQAIASLAYGTETIPAVDKIVGPGNIYVALAKQAVYGQVDIDSIAGPSEIVVVADDTANPRFVAADLLSQAEHDPMAAAILLTPSTQLAEKVKNRIHHQLELLERKKIASASLRDYGAICLTSDLQEAIEVANRLAPEHLELAVAEPWEWLTYVKNAGAIFLGHYSPETIGDYFAGPNHVLPTNGTARFFSPLGVDSFIKRSSVIAYSQAAFKRDANKVITLANAEGLGAHAASIQVRMTEEDE